MAQPSGHSTAPWHGLGAGNWHEAAHKEGAAGSLGSDRLDTPTLAIHFLWLTYAGLCPGSYGNGEGRVPWKGRSHPAASWPCPGELLVEQMPCTAPPRSVAVQVPSPWDIASSGKEWCGVSAAAGSWSIRHPSRHAAPHASLPAAAGTFLPRRAGSPGNAEPLARQPTRRPFVCRRGPPCRLGAGACPGCRSLAGLASAGGRAVGASRQKESAVTFP